MIKNLDHEMSELKLANRDLQRDIEGCQARESKMLTLQSELSRTNALLRSENTNLNNQVKNFPSNKNKLLLCMIFFFLRVGGGGEGEDFQHLVKN